MSERIPFTYGEFYDLPRMIQLQFRNRWFFLRSYFDDVRDDYADCYDVYLLPFPQDYDFAANPRYWLDLTDAIHLGQIRAIDLGIDETRRRSIDETKFSEWLDRQAR